MVTLHLKLRVYKERQRVDINENIMDTMKLGLVNSPLNLQRAGLRWKFCN